VLVELLDEFKDSRMVYLIWDGGKSHILFWVNGSFYPIRAFFLTQFRTPFLKLPAYAEYQ